MDPARVSFLSGKTDPHWTPQQWREYYAQKVILELRMHHAVMYDQMRLERRSNDVQQR